MNKRFSFSRRSKWSAIALSMALLLRSLVLPQRLQLSLMVYERPRGTEAEG